jgi:hypothetical protein
MGAFFSSYESHWDKINKQYGKRFIDDDLILYNGVYYLKNNKTSKITKLITTSENLTRIDHTKYYKI